MTGPDDQTVGDDSGEVDEIKQAIEAKKREGEAFVVTIKEGAQWLMGYAGEDDKQLNTNTDIGNLNVGFRDGQIEINYTDLRECSHIMYNIVFDEFGFDFWEEGEDAQSIDEIYAALKRASVMDDAEYLRSTLELINEVVAKVKEAVEEGRAETVQVLSALIRTASGFEEIESGLETPEE